MLRGGSTGVTTTGVTGTTTGVCGFVGVIVVFKGSTSPVLLVLPDGFKPPVELLVPGVMTLPSFGNSSGFVG